MPRHFAPKGFLLEAQSRVRGPLKVPTDMIRHGSATLAPTSQVFVSPVPFKPRVIDVPTKMAEVAQ